MVRGGESTIIQVFLVPKSCHFGSVNLFFHLVFCCGYLFNLEKTQLNLKIIHVGLFANFFFFFAFVGFFDHSFLLIAK